MAGVVLSTLFVSVGCRPTSDTEGSTSQRDDDRTGSSAEDDRSVAIGIARREVSRRLSREAQERESPWAIAHVILALGDTVRWEGQSAVPRLRDRWLRQRGDGSRHFDLNRSVTLGEQHPHLVLKNLAETEIGSDLLEPLVESAAAKFQSPKTWEEWNDCAWLLEGLAWRPAPPPALGDGVGSTDVRSLAAGLLEVFVAADGVVDRELAKGPNRFDRPNGEGGPEAAGTYAYTCGGLHILQALIKAAERGWLNEVQRERLKQRVVVFLRRLDREFEFRELESARAVSEGAEPTVARTMQHMFTLKLLGHGLEIAARARLASLPFSDREKREVSGSVRRARARLGQLFVDLTTQLDPEDQLWVSLRTRKHPFWELWFGDSCHALRGLQLTD